MTQIFQCGNRAALVDYLYDECGPAERTAVAAHMAVCRACAEEASRLRTTRAELTEWTVPDLPLGFRVVHEMPPARVTRAEESPVSPSASARWWQHPVPAWAQVAAAALLFAGGLTLGALRATSEPDQTTAARAFVQAPGTQDAAGTSPANRPGATTAAASTASATLVSPEDLAALEQRLRAELAQNRDASTSGPPTKADAQLLQQVRALIQESEQRQQRELALRTAEVVRDFDAQRRGDLTRIERTFGQMEGTTGAQVEQQRQVLDYLMRVSQRQP